MKFKIDLSWSKIIKLRVALAVGRAEGARLDLRFKLRGREPLRWRAALAPAASTRELSEPIFPTLTPERDPPPRA